MVTSKYFNVFMTFRRKKKIIVVPMKGMIIQMVQHIISCIAFSTSTLTLVV